ncbi:MAG: light-harvesting antenna LH1, beta subunit [Maricaulaceae bacterium]
MADDTTSMWTGLTDEEAQEFHKYYLQGTSLFVGTAVAAHFLVWIWRPWIPPEEGYGAAEAAANVTNALLPLLG